MTTRSWVEERPGPSAPAAILAVSATVSLALLAVLSLDRIPPRPIIRQSPPVLRIVAAGKPPAPPAPSLPKARTLVRLPTVRISEPAIRIAAAPVPVQRRPAMPRATATRPAAIPAVTPQASFRPPSASAAVAPSASPDAIRTLEGEIRQAVQDALRYPAASRLMGDEGRSLVGFTYRDRAVSEVRLLASSGIVRLDQAAIETVQDATYPPPGRAAGRALSLAVWVTFRIGDG